MKVILIENVKGTGKKDEIKEVKDGFASFLIKSKKAVLYTTKSNEVLKSELQTRKEQEEATLKEAEALKEKLEKIHLTFKVKSGSNGKVFGSISSKQISEELKKKNFDIDKKLITSEQLNTLGTHLVSIALHKKVTATLTVVLEGSD